MHCIEPDQNSVDCTTEFLTDFLVNAAIKAANNGIAISCRGQKKGTSRNWKFRKKTSRKIVKPKWHGATCESCEVVFFPQSCLIFTLTRFAAFLTSHVAQSKLTTQT